MTRTPWREKRILAMCLGLILLSPSQMSQAADDRKVPFPGAQNQHFYRYDLRELLARDQDAIVYVWRTGSGAYDAGSSRSVPLADHDPGPTYAKRLIQDDSDVHISRCVPRDDESLPTIEVFSPALSLFEILSLEEPVATVVLFSSDEPNRMASRLLAHSLAKQGAEVIVLPLFAGDDRSPRAGIVLAKGLATAFGRASGKHPIVYLGLGLGAGPAFAAAARDPAATHLVLAFTSAELPDRIASDDVTAKWLGFTDPKERAQMSRKSLHLLPRAITTDLGACKVLFVGAKGEQHLPLAEQKALLEQMPKAESWWHDGSLRSLAKDADAVAARIIQFVTR